MSYLFSSSSSNSTPAKDDHKDDTVVVPTPLDSLTISKSMLKTAMHSLRTNGSKKGGFRGLKPVRAKMWSSGIGSNSGSGSALNAATNVSTASFTEIASYAAVYDEMRVLSGVLHWHAFTNATGSQPNSVAWMAVNFDPITPVPSTYPQGFTYNTGPYALYSENAGTPFGPQKYHKLSFKMPGPLAPITSTDIPGNAWIALDTSTAPVLLDVVQHVDAFGGSGTSGTYFFLELNCEFRMRV